VCVCVCVCGSVYLIDRKSSLGSLKPIPQHLLKSRAACMPQTNECDFVCMDFLVLQHCGAGLGYVNRGLTQNQAFICMKCIFPSRHEAQFQAL